MAAEHHYERPIVFDITQRRYWEREEQVALHALSVAQENLRKPIVTQLRIDLYPLAEVIPIKPDYPNISA